jgi:ketosteroid isomerase-like protein
MQHRMKLVAFVVSAAAVTAACGPKPAASTDSAGATTAAAPAFDKSAAEAEIRANDKTYFDGVTAKDVKMIASGYANDAVSMPPNVPPLVGHDAMDKYNADMLKIPGFDITGEATEIHFSDDGTMAYAIGKYTAHYNDAKGKKLTEEGKYLEVVKKVDGKWKIVSDAFSPNAAPKM